MVEIGAVNAPAGIAGCADHPLATALRAAFAQHRDAVLTAPPGAGKSTIVPLALLAEPWLAGRKILMLEPRRLAARAVATRMAQTLGERPGECIGWRMRMDTKVSARTRIEVITEGVLARLLQSDPALEGVGCVIFDEYHERSLQADLGLALCLDARVQLDAKFRLLVMSATLDGAQVAKLLDDAPVVDVPGRAFPVQIVYAGKGSPPLPAVFGAGAPRGAADSPERLFAALVRRALQETQGDVLGFLPGAGEIRRVQGLLGDLPASGAGAVRVLPLYGELAADVQDAALRALPDARRVVLATNIAETSLTIPGVTVVVDSGLVRRSRFDPVSGMSRLEVMRIARASAEQRAGRAGRTAPGHCYRLWSEGAHAALAAHTPAEILEADLAPLALELAAWGAEGAALRWLDPPPAATLGQARDLLQRLGALDAQGRITGAGRDMARLPVHPRLAHMLLYARAHGGVRLAAELAALLAERDLLRRSGGRDADMRSRLEVLRRESNADVDRGVLDRVRRNARQLAQQVQAPAHEAGSDDWSDEWAGALLAQAFPDRVGQRRGAPGQAAAGRDAGTARYLLSNGRGAVFTGAQSLGRSEYLVAVELNDQDREARIDLAAPLTLEQIERGFVQELQTRSSVHWDAQAEAISARRVRALGALVLDEQPLRDVPAEAMTAAMLEGVRALGIEALPWERDSRNLQARLEFVRRLPRSDLSDWPDSSDAGLLATLDAWLPPWLAGMTRRDHLARLKLPDLLLGRLTHAQRRQLEELAPRELTVPTGSRVRIDYDDDNAPCVEVRLQEVFGLAATPRIGAGTVPVTFKLLSPARRPVQITRDLAGFWRSSYYEVRKDLRGRYPRHHWPENPLEAEPTRGIKRR